MKLKGAFFLLTTLLLLFSSSQVERDEVAILPITTDDCYTENNSFGHGERVVYKVFYNWNFVWLPAGEVIFEVNETDTSYDISAVGRTYATYEWFFKVRDYYSTSISKETLLPNTFIRDVAEGSYTIYDKINFDQENSRGTSFRGKNKEVAKLEEFEFDNCMHDLLSIIYKMRNLDYQNFDADSKIPAKIFLDMETYPIDIKIEGKEKKKWIKGLGYFDTFKISPELIAGNVFDEDQHMKIWVSDDSNKVPLMIESPVSVGSLKVILKDYEGLKHPFSSKVEK